MRREHILSISLTPTQPADIVRLCGLVKENSNGDVTYAVDGNTVILSANSETSLRALIQHLRSQLTSDFHVGEFIVHRFESIRFTARGSAYSESADGLTTVCTVEVAPLPRGAGIVFAGQDVELVEDLFRALMTSGRIEGHPLTDLKVTLITPCSNSELSSAALRDALDKASPVVLEPIMRWTFQTPMVYVGDMASLVNERGGRISDLEQPTNHQCRGHGEIALSLALGYLDWLPPETKFELQYSHYAEVPNSNFGLGLE